MSSTAVRRTTFLAEKNLAAPVGKVFPLSEAAAHRLLKENTLPRPGR
jgi:hypothetical protein